jgi:hypothetical protein
LPTIVSLGVPVFRHCRPRFELPDSMSCLRERLDQSQIVAGRLDLPAATCPSSRDICSAARRGGASSSERRCRPVTRREARRREPALCGRVGRRVKYMEPKDVPALEGTELRRRNAPSLRVLVRLAQQCDSAEQLGKRLRRRYMRQQARQGLITPTTPAPLRPTERALHSRRAS